MSAVAMEQNRQVKYGRMSFSALRKLAHDIEWWDQDEAARQYCLRMIDMAVEVALDIRHTEGYFPPISPTAKIGEPLGDSVGPRETLAYICDRPMPESKMHRDCYNNIKMLGTEKMVAVLIRGAKKSGNTLDGWSLDYDKIAANIDYYVRMLGFSPFMENIRFGSGKSIETKAYRGLCTLIEAAKKGLV